MIYFNKIKQNTEANNLLLDEVIQLTKLKNDAALSRALGVSPPVISKIRSGRLPVGATIALSIHEISDMPFVRIKEIMGGGSKGDIAINAVKG